MELIEDLGMIANKSGNRYRYGLYKCGSCGEPFKTTVQNAKRNKSGNCKTCVLVERNFKHGLSREPFYEVWNNMMARCYRKSNRQFKDWGGRGISVCAEWHDPKCFKDWFVKNYINGLQIDRRNNDGNYEPSNCRFVTRSVNTENKRVQSTKFGKYKYVNWSKRENKWIVVYKKKYVGSFLDEDEAYRELCNYRNVRS